MSKKAYSIFTNFFRNLTSNVKSNKNRLSKDEIAVIKNKQRERRGLKGFIYGEDENIVWAINQGTADKKARKRGYLDQDKEIILPNKDGEILGLNLYKKK